MGIRVDSEKIRLTWVPKMTQPKTGTNKNCPGKVKATDVILTILPTEFRLVYKSMIASAKCSTCLDTEGDFYHEIT